MDDTARAHSERLLHVILGISTDLELDATLTRIIGAAIDLTGARYGALGVRGRDGTLTSFLYQGMDDGAVALIGHLPVGRGVLGVPLEHTPALRLDDIADHPAATGFPPHHPAMHAFLGVPITIRGTVFGSLYVTHDTPRRVFSESDEVATRLLASAAAVAIDNARLFEHARAAATWTQASREITTALSSAGAPQPDPLQLIAERARELTQAEQAIVLVPESPNESTGSVDTLVVSAAVGVHADTVLGQRVPVAGSTSGGVFRSGVAELTDTFRHPIAAFTDAGPRPAIVMPLRADDAVIGVIAVARPAHGAPFDPDYLDLVSDFATHAAIALTLAAARTRDRDLTVLADRERIAHDLHDHVIQRLFAAGLDIQGTIARSQAPELNARLARTLDDLQATIETIRGTIFALQSPNASDFRTRLQRLVADLTHDRDVTGTVRISGPVGAVTGATADHAEAVVGEAVSNAVRHAGATRISVTVDVADELVLDVTDDGGGIPAANTRLSGLANMSRRAELLGGSCDVSSSPGTGTRVRWTVPIVTE